MEGISGSREKVGGVVKSWSGMSIVTGAEPFWNWNMSDHISLKALVSGNDGAGSGVMLKSGCHVDDCGGGGDACGGGGAAAVFDDRDADRPFELPSQSCSTLRTHVF